MVGLIVLLFSALFLFSALPVGPNNGPVKCGGVLMRPGDFCEERSDGKTVAFDSYADVAQRQHAAHGIVWWAAALGMAGVAGGLSYLGWPLVSARRQRHTAAMLQALEDEELDDDEVRDS